jgi:hypothetical protein
MPQWAQRYPLGPRIQPCLHCSCLNSTTGSSDNFDSLFICFNRSSKIPRLYEEQADPRWLDHVFAAKFAMPGVLPTRFSG